MGWGVGGGGGRKRQSDVTLYQMEAIHVTNSCCCDFSNKYTVNPVLSGHSKIDKTKVLKTDYRLMQIKSTANSAILLTCIKR